MSQFSYWDKDRTVKLAASLIKPQQRDVLKSKDYKDYYFSSQLIPHIKISNI